VLFLATEYVTVPAPVPDALTAATATHVALDTAVQAQPVPQLTDTLPLPPACPNCSLAAADNV
jgi:hypothetical protein